MIDRRPPAACGDHNREADLSTEQIGAQTPTRFPRPHGNHGRPQGGGGPALARSQATERL